MTRNPPSHDLESLRLSFQRLALTAHPAYKPPAVRQVKRLLLELLGDLEAERALNAVARENDTQDTPDFMPPLSLADLEVLESALRFTSPDELN